MGPCRVGDDQRRARRRLSLLCAVVGALGTACSPAWRPRTPTRDEPPPLKSLRYDEDFSSLRDPAARTGDPLSLEPLKFIALDDAGDSYLTLGGELREQVEWYADQEFGLGAKRRDAYLLQRYMLHGDLHLGSSMRLFAQLASGIASWLEATPDPPDVDRLDLHQAFVDVGLPGLTLRLGRQEMLYGAQRLISVREGPNVRLGFDAVRLLAERGDWRADAFYARPVETDPGVFDDGWEPGEQLWGAYATGAHVDLYYLGYRKPDATYDQGTADEQRHTVGVRLFAEGDALDYNFELVYQWGSFGRGRIRAWAIASDTGYTFADAPLSPRIALRGGAISGDQDPTDPDLETLNPLFPRGDYFGEAATLGPLNLIEVHPILSVNVTETLMIQAAWTWYWRTDLDDGIYGNGINLIQSAAGSDERFIGSEGSCSIEWQAHRHVSVSAAYSHFFAGAFVEDTGPGHSIDYAMVLGAYKF